MIPNLTVELGLTANPLDPVAGIAWTDISPFVREVRTKRGRQHELARFEAGEALLVLDNSDRRFDPSWTSGPYGAAIGPMRRVRIRDTPSGSHLFTGYSEAWRPTWSGPSEALVQLDCVDATKLLALTRPTRTPFSDAILRLSPYLYWRLGETVGNQCADSSGNSRTGTHNYGVVPGIDGLVPYDDDKAANYSSLGHTETASSAIADYERTQAFWVAGIASIPNNGTIWLASKGPATTSLGRGWGIALSPSGVVFDLVSTWNTNALQVAAPRPVNDAAPHLVLVSYDGSSTPGGVRIWVDGQECDLRTFLNTLTGTTLNGERLKIGPIGRELGTTLDEAANTDLDEFAIGLGTLNTTTAASIWNAYTSAWDGHRAGERFTALLDLAGWPTNDRTIDPGIISLGPQTPPGSLLDELAAIADSELGACYITPDGKIRFSGRYANQIGSASVLTFGDDAAGVESEYLGFEVAADDTDLWNQIDATRPGGSPQTVTHDASITTYGRRVKQFSGVWRDDNQALAVAQTYRDRYALPKPRYTSLRIRPINTTELNAILALQLHTSRVTVKSRPVGGGTANTQECVVESIAHSIGVDRWDITLGLVPADPAIAAGGYFTLGTSQLNSAAALPA